MLLLLATPAELKRQLLIQNTIEMQPSNAFSAKLPRAKSHEFLRQKNVIAVHAVGKVVRIIFLRMGGCSPPNPPLFWKTSTLTVKQIMPSPCSQQGLLCGSCCVQVEGLPLHPPPAFLKPYMLANGGACTPPNPPRIFEALHAYNKNIKSSPVCSCANPFGGEWGACAPPNPPLG